MRRVLVWVSGALFASIAYNVAPDLRSYLVLGASALFLALSSAAVAYFDFPREDAQ